MSEHAPNGTPFCWIPKAGLAQIDKHLELSQAATAKLVYLALCRVACDDRTATFSKPIAYLATLASLDRRTVERRLPDLEHLKLVTIARGKLRVAHTFTLATYSRNDTSLSRNVATLPYDSQSHLVESTERRGGKLKTADRIGLENKLKITKERLQTLRGETSEEWQRQTSPHLVTERKKLEADVKELENQLLA